MDQSRKIHLINFVDLNIVISFRPKGANVIFITDMLLHKAFITIHKDLECRVWRLDKVEDLDNKIKVDALCDFDLKQIIRNENPKNYQNIKKVSESVLCLIGSFTYIIKLKIEVDDINFTLVSKIDYGVQDVFNLNSNHKFLFRYENNLMVYDFEDQKILSIYSIPQYLRLHLIQVLIFAWDEEVEVCKLLFYDLLNEDYEDIDIFVVKNPKVLSCIVKGGKINYCVDRNEQFMFNLIEMKALIIQPNGNSLNFKEICREGN